MEPADGLSRPAFEVSLIFYTPRLRICALWKVSKTYLNFFQMVIKFYMRSVGVNKACVSTKGMGT
jgi:hypothetical protein